MAFAKKTWKDRVSQYPNRRTINDGVVTKTVTVGRDEGEVTQEGDAFSASAMNDLERRIYNAIEEEAVGDQYYTKTETDNLLDDINNDIEQLKADISTLDSDLSVLTQEIHVGEGLEYEEIQEALDSLTSDYATIIVHPKDTPYSRFSLMRKLSGSYPWSGLKTVKHISIIGVDKSKCIIKDDSGDHNTPPAEIATNGVIENLTFIATHSNSTGTETTGSYAVHVDNRPADINGMKLIFRNCDFTSYQMSAVGLGLYRNQNILFDSCNFYSYTDINWQPNQDYDSSYFCTLGAFFMHTTMGYAGGNMFIRFRNCFLYHSGGSYSMRIADKDTTKTALLEALNNTCWCEDSDNTGVLISGIKLQPYNHGNNAANLNS